MTDYDPTYGLGDDYLHENADIAGSRADSVHQSTFHEAETEFHNPPSLFAAGAQSPRLSVGGSEARPFYFDEFGIPNYDL